MGNVRFGEKTKLDYLGRNGYGHCVGLTVYRIGDEIILIPTNTRGLAQCSIPVPMAHLDEVIAVLEKEKNQSSERLDPVESTIDCARCGSSHTTVVDTKDVGGEGYDAYVCRSCGHEGKAHYKIE
jgi:hypothetical protein